MPYTLRRKKDGKWQVVNKETGEVHAKGTTHEKAQRQMNLMMATEHGWKPTGKKART